MWVPYGVSSVVSNGVLDLIRHPEADLYPHHYNTLELDRGNFFVMFWMFLDNFAECNVFDDAFELVY